MIKTKLWILQKVEQIYKTLARIGKMKRKKIEQKEIAIQMRLKE